VKRYRQFIIGLLVGAMLFSEIGVYAEDILNVLTNPFPVVINGQAVQIEAYNINGFTFLKLADVGKALDSTVYFNETEKRIEITANKKVSINDEYMLDSSSIEKTSKN
jgi:hypothetical protein